MMRLSWGRSLKKRAIPGKFSFTPTDTLNMCRFLNSAPSEATVNTLFPFLLKRRALEEAHSKAEKHALLKLLEHLGKTEVPNPATDLTEAEPITAKALKTCDWLYSLLNTLDSKASALMRLNGVMVAAMSFLSGPVQPVSPLSGQPQAVLHHTFSALENTLLASLVLSSLASIISIGLCLFVVAIDWDFYEHVKLDPTPDFSREVYELQKITLCRQRCYRLAWRFSAVGILVFFGCVCLRLWLMI